MTDWGRRLIIILALLAGSAVMSCQSQAPGDRITVVATIFPLADMVKNVAQDKVEVVTLLPAGGSPHTYEPTPGDVKAVARARLMVINGAGLDFWISDLRSAGENLTVLDTSTALAGEDLLVSIEERGEGVNPHYWVDPLLAKKQLESIAQALMGVDPANADYYRENADRYGHELDSLHQEILDVTSSFTSRQFITFHPAWTYFAKRYGLIEAAVIEEAPGKEPSAQYRAHVVDVAKSLGIKVIFAEPQFSSKDADAIAADSGARVLLLDPMGGSGLDQRDSYMNLMRYNLAQMTEAMR